MEQGLYIKYFVLKPNGSSEYSKASRAAMLAYADAIEKTNKRLSNQLIDWAIVELNLCRKGKEDE